MKQLGVRAALVAGVLAVATLGPIRAQVPKPADNNITPVYEGWLPRADGSFDLVFGYLNRECDEAASIPIGPNNSIDPGGPDQGQPTHFFPRRNRFVFTVHVPKEFGTKEIVWTLTSKGRTEKTFATLKNDYVLDDTVIMSNIGAGGALSTSPDMVGNKAPVLTVEGPAMRSAKVGDPVALAAIATDDGKPNKRNMPAALGGSSCRRPPMVFACRSSCIAAPAPRSPSTRHKPKSGKTPAMAAARPGQPALSCQRCPKETGGRHERLSRSPEPT